MKLQVHPTVTAALSTWQRCRDTQDGSDSVKGRGKVYLPPLAHAHLYDRYLARAVFLEVTAATVSGLLGMVFRRDPEVSLHAALDALNTDADLAGNDLYSVIKTVTGETLNPGRCGVLVDSNATRPYLVVYRAEDVLNWRTETGQDGVRRVSLVVLRETFEEAVPSEPYAVKTATRFRVWELRNGVAQVTLFRPADSAAVATTNQPTQAIAGIEVLPIGAPVIPTRRGQTLDRIPFVFFNAGSTEPAILPAPLRGVVDLNLSHFRTYADLEHSRHYVACPQAYAVGFTPADGRLEFGSSSVWLSEQPHAKAGFLEQPPFDGLVEALKQKEEQMASMGASLLIAKPRAAETAEAARIHAGKTASPLMHIVTSVSVGLTQVLRHAAYWLLVDEGSCSCELNTEFTENNLDPAALQALVSSWQAGAMSKTTLVTNLQRHELLPAGRTVEEELAEIDAELATADPATTDTTADNDQTVPAQ